MKPCIKCGAMERRANGQCRPCGRNQSLKYYRLHRVERAEYRKTRSVEEAERRRKWNRAHRTETAAYARVRRQNNLLYRLSRNLRTRLGEALRGNFKAGSAVADLGCTIPELRAHLEAQFKPGMTWENWGRHGWHIDHVKPLASFDLTDRGQFLAACHYTNLQPLWWDENLRKGGRCAA